MLRGLSTISFYADDLEKAEQWYAELLDTQAYFSRPGYVEFRIGDYQHELGLIDRKYAPKSAATDPGGTIAYWHVDDIEASLDRLLSLGAKEYEPIMERGEGFITASVLDPFGNVLGIMYNKHYLEMLNSPTN